MKTVMELVESVVVENDEFKIKNMTKPLARTLDNRSIVATFFCCLSESSVTYRNARAELKENAQDHQQCQSGRKEIEELICDRTYSTEVAHARCHLKVLG